MHAAFDNDLEVCMGVSGWRTIASCAVVLGALLTGRTPKQETSVTAQSGQASAPAAAPLKPIAGIQDIMAGMIDPAADFLWASVSTTVVGNETVEKQPRTDEEWAEVRRQAILLA